MALSITCGHPFTQRPTSNMLTTDVTITDTVGGTTIDYRLVDINGVQPAWQPWSTIGTTIAGSKKFGCNVKVGGPWFAQVRDHNNQSVVVQSTDSYLVGDVRLYVGQSNGYGMWGRISGTAPAALPQTKIYIPPGAMASGVSGWITPTGDGAIALLNGLHASTGVPQALLGAAKGGTPLTLEGVTRSRENASNPTDWWMYNKDMNGAAQGGSYGEAWSWLINSMAQVGNKITGVIWDGNESDMAAGTYRDIVYRNFVEYWASIAGLVGADRRSQSMHFAMVRAFIDPAALPGFDQTEVRLAQNKFMTTLPEAYIAAQRDDLPRDTDNLHLTTASFATLGARLATGIYAKEYNF